MLPAKKEIVVAEGRATLADDRVSVVEGWDDLLGRCDPIFYRTTAVLLAVGEDRPALVAAGLDAVELVAAACAVFEFPECPVRPQRRGLDVAVP